MTQQNAESDLVKTCRAYIADKVGLGFDQNKDVTVSPGDFHVTFNNRDIYNRFYHGVTKSRLEMYRTSLYLGVPSGVNGVPGQVWNMRLDSSKTGFMAFLDYLVGR